MRIKKGEIEGEKSEIGSQGRSKGIKGRGEGRKGKDNCVELSSVEVKVITLREGGVRTDEK